MREVASVSEPENIFTVPLKGPLKCISERPWGAKRNCISHKNLIFFTFDFLADLLQVGRAIYENLCHLYINNILIHLRMKIL